MAAILTVGSVSLVGLTACETAPKSEEGRSSLRFDAQNALNKAQSNDPSLKALLDKAHGYAVFPTVGKGAVGIGGAYGKGVVYEAGKVVGYCDMTQATIGLALGGQSYTQIIAFETSTALSRFKSGNFAFDANATAVALKSGSAATAKYADGVSVFTMDESGLMAAASIGGQKFNYKVE
jgi:lipid-binding SYLF domain-containing protein